MAQPVMQKAFHAGEWSPSLNARVDVAKYHSAAALMKNYYVDYRGGASSRPGTKYILQAYKSASAVRLITFQASFEVGYILEFGDQYIRFFNNGSAILETAKNITGATQANPCVITSTSHGYSTGDWVYISSVGGMTQLNGKYYRVTRINANTFSLQAILDSSNINSSGYTAYTSGGTAQRVYTLPSPYLATDLAKVKFVQQVDTLILCHPNYQPYVLTLVSSNNWTLTPINFGTTVATPTGVSVATTLAAGNVDYAYAVTAVDINGQESAVSTAGTLSSKQDLRSTAGTNTVTWNAVSGAQSYNVYKSELSYNGAVPGGSTFGFVGNVSGTTLIDSNIAPDFSITPPVVQNPFQGAGITSVTVTASGTYTTVPTATIGAAPSGGVTATVQVYVGVTATGAVSGANPGFAVGDLIVPEAAAYGGLTLRVTAVSGSSPSAVEIVAPGGISSGTTPSNPVTFRRATSLATACNVALTWGVVVVSVVSPGAGYTSAPSVTFSAGTATATTTLGTASEGNPAVPAFFGQRLVLAALASAPQTFHMSQPGSPYNFNVRRPIQEDDALSGAIYSGQLNTIRSMIPMPTGLITLSDKAAWLINGGNSGEPITPINADANAQAYNGASDVPPIVANYDILYVQAKGSVIRDLTYNFYTNIFSGTDISILSSHLFFGHTITEWSWAEEPFKLVWAIRDDGALLSLTFMKEQELIGWAQHDTQGDWKSTAVCTESVTGFGYVDAQYFVVERTIGATTVKFIERMADRYFYEVDGEGTKYYSPWCVDAGLRYDSTPATTFSGLEHLAGMAIVGLADGVPFQATVSATGTFTLATAASFVTAGLAFVPELQTLAIDTGEPTIQSKQKKIPAVTLRLQETLGLTIGTDANNQVNMKDLILGNVGSMTNKVVEDLVTGDARTYIDPKWDAQGQYLIRQPLPYPSTILGVIPQLMVGDTVK